MSFVGNRDPFRDGEEAGPLLSLLEHREYDTVVLLCTGADYLDRAKRVEQKSEELVGKLAFDMRMVELESVVDYQEILTKLTALLDQITKKYAHRTPTYEILLDPGTPQMQTVWFILAQRGVVDATLLQGVPPHLAGGSYRVKEIDPLPLIQEGYARARAGTGEAEVAETPGTVAEPEQAAVQEPWPIIGESKALENAIQMARNAAAYDLPLLIRGETGTGKELFARLIHREGPRAHTPFTAFNCSAIPDGLAESALFGHVAGAFTDAKEPRLGVFRSASGGTLFLDEVGDLPPAVQPKLLRVLEEHFVTPVGSDTPEPIELHLVAATNRPLEELVAEGSFRRDLLIRLSQVVIEIPSLRERSEDIPLLLDHFLTQWNQTYKENRTFSPELLDLLGRYPWPGNVRELESAVRAICATQPSQRLTPATLPPSISRHFSSQGQPEAEGLSFDLPAEGLDLKAYLYQIEKYFYELALSRTDNNGEQAAKLLGLNGAAFRKALRERFALE